MDEFALFIYKFVINISRNKIFELFHGQFNPLTLKRKNDMLLFLLYYIALLFCRKSVHHLELVVQ